MNEEGTFFLENCTLVELLLDDYLFMRLENLRTTLNI